MIGHLVYLFEIYYVIWWTVLFAVLPLGITTYADAGIKVTDGGEPAAPIDPKLTKKFLTTTWVSAALMAIGYAIWASDIIHLPNLAP